MRQREGGKVRHPRHVSLHSLESHAERPPVPVKAYLTLVHVEAAPDHVSRHPRLAVRMARHVPLSHALSVVSIRVWEIPHSLLVGERARWRRPTDLLYPSRAQYDLVLPRPRQHASVRPRRAKVAERFHPKVVLVHFDVPVARLGVQAHRRWPEPGWHLLGPGAPLLLVILLVIRVKRGPRGRLACRPPLRGLLLLHQRVHETLQVFFQPLQPSSFPVPLVGPGEIPGAREHLTRVPQNLPHEPFLRGRRSSVQARGTSGDVLLRLEEAEGHLILLLQRCHLRVFF
mmetsp:Transcript_4332/g.12740  ORF Transcript_4332/g.12740 Transcript_4332/m.12740 type:complete len:286 (+) Transcript_4332:3007-3864(+)